MGGVCWWASPIGYTLELLRSEWLNLEPLALDMSRIFLIPIIGNVIWFNSGQRICRRRHRLRCHRPVVGRHLLYM